MLWKVKSNFRIRFRHKNSEWPKCWLSLPRINHLPRLLMWRQSNMTILSALEFKTHRGLMKRLRHLSKDLPRDLHIRWSLSVICWRIRLKSRNLWLKEFKHWKPWQYLAIRFRLYKPLVSNNKVRLGLNPPTSQKREARVLKVRPLKVLRNLTKSLNKSLNLPSSFVWRIIQSSSKKGHRQLGPHLIDIWRSFLKVSYQAKDPPKSLNNELKEQLKNYLGNNRQVMSKLLDPDQILGPKEVSNSHPKSMRLSTLIHLKLQSKKMKCIIKLQFLHLKWKVLRVLTKLPKLVHNKEGLLSRIFLDWSLRLIPRSQRPGHLKVWIPGQWLDPR